MSGELFFGALFVILVPVPIIVGTLKRNDPNTDTGLFLLGGGIWAGAAIAGFFIVGSLSHFDGVATYLEFLVRLAILILLAGPVLGVIDRLKKTHVYSRPIWFLVGGGVEMLVVWALLWNIMTY